jgi:hypothetical protein
MNDLNVLPKTSLPLWSIAAAAAVALHLGGAGLRI